MTNKAKALIEALCRAIEQHEQFKREVSDAVHKHWGDMPCEFDRFILPKPVDPLVEVAEELRETYCATGADWAKATRAALAKRGGKIVWENEP